MCTSLATGLARLAVRCTTAVFKIDTCVKSRGGDFVVVSMYSNLRRAKLKITVDTKHRNNKSEGYTKIYTGI